MLIMMSACIVNLYYGCNSIQFAFLSCIWLITCHFMHPSSCVLYVHTCIMHTSILVHDHLHIYAFYDPSRLVKSCISHVIMYLASCIHLHNLMIASVYIIISLGLLVKMERTQIFV